jgi:hypothetical protein
MMCRLASLDQEKSNERCVIILSNDIKVERSGLSILHIGCSVSSVHPDSDKKVFTKSTVALDEGRSRSNSNDRNRGRRRYSRAAGESIERCVRDLDVVLIRCPVDICPRRGKKGRATKCVKLFATLTIVKTDVGNPSGSPGAFWMQARVLKCVT